jgi:hypothetical protein
MRLALLDAYFFEKRLDIALRIEMRSNHFFESSALLSKKWFLAKDRGLNKV